MDQHPPPGPRRHLVDAGGPIRPSPSAASAPLQVDRVAALIHDLNNLLDGSLRCIASAQRALDPASSAPDAIDHARARVELVRASLERMLEMLHAAMRSVHNKLGTSSLMPMQPISLAEAIAHAAEVLRPEAFELGIKILAAVDPTVGSTPAGPIYTVLLNGIKNAIEALTRESCPPKDGSIEIQARPADADTAASISCAAPAILVTITDNGPGLRPLDAARAFDPGISAKSHGLGLGLSIAREVMHSLGGRIELLGHASGKPGATLRLIYPTQPKPADDALDQRALLGPNGSGPERPA
jgi:signal transduction histidine kinase